MNRRLSAKALLAKADSNDERKDLLENVHFLDAAGISRDEAKLLISEDNEDINKFNTERGFIKSEGLEGTSYTLIQEEVYNTVIAGTEPTKIFRDILPIVQMGTGYSLRVPKGSAGVYAPVVAEGQPIEINTQTYTHKDITIDKYGWRPVITKEYIDDNLFDIVDLELRKLGMALENALNRECLDQLISDMTDISQVDPGAGDHIQLSDIAVARSKVLAQNRFPDTLILHPTAEGYMLQDSNLVYVAYAGQGRTLETGEIPTLLGLTPYTCTATDGSSPTWDDTTGGSDVTGMILDNTAPAAMIAMKNDINIEQYADPIHDLVGLAGTIRFGAETINTDAGVQIYHR